MAPPTLGILPTARVASLLIPLGALFLLFLTSDRGLLAASVGCFLMGFGMGIISITGTMLVQESVEWSMRGSATSSIIFSRSLGNTLGAAALGAVLSVGIRHYGSGELAGRLHALLNEPSGLRELAGNTDIRMVFFHALYWSFCGVVLVAMLAVISVWLIPQVNKSTDASAAEVADAVADRATKHGTDSAFASRSAPPPMSACDPKNFRDARRAGGARRVGHHQARRSDRAAAGRADLLSRDLPGPRRPRDPERAGERALPHRAGGPPRRAVRLLGRRGRPGPDVRWIASWDLDGRTPHGVDIAPTA